LEAAEQHLSAALERLQAALNRRVAVGGREDVRLAGLPDDVNALREECQTLRAVTDHVAQRLDSSIDELDRMLEG
ncbi:MAG: hypothetical protein ACREH3_02315, partial [Geminicoccales bacterium]